MKPKIFFKAAVSSDMAKEKFDGCIAVMDEQQNVSLLLSKTYHNNPAGFKEFLKDIKARLGTNKFQVVMEATGTYHEPLAFWLYKEGVSVVVELPTKMKKYMGSLNLKSKTDKIDAKAMVRYALERKLADWVPPKDELLQLRVLTRELYQLNKDITSCKNRIEAIKHGKEVDSGRRVLRLKEQIKLFEQHLVQAEAEIKQLLDQYPWLKELVEIVDSITGIAQQTACTIIAETFAFRDFHTRNQLVSYAGYDVVYRESGKSINGAKKISKRGNKYLRAALYMPAMAAINHDKRFSSISKRIEQKTGFYKKGNVAIQRRLLVLAYHLVKSGKKFSKEVHEQKNRETQGLPALDAPLEGALSVNQS